jgi:2-iminoacetate synthase ThiH
VAVVAVATILDLVVRAAQLALAVIAQPVADTEQIKTEAMPVDTEALVQAAKLIFTAAVVVATVLDIITSKAVVLGKAAKVSLVAAALDDTAGTVLVQ